MVGWDHMTAGTVAWQISDQPWCGELRGVTRLVSHCVA
jgi:hypothetical protein